MAKGRKRTSSEKRQYTNLVKYGAQKGNPTNNPADTPIDKEESLSTLDLFENSSSKSQVDYTKNQKSKLTKRPEDPKDAILEWVKNYWKGVLAAVVTAAVVFPLGYLAWNLAISVERINTKIENIEKTLDEIKIKVEKVDDENHQQNLNIQGNSKEIDFLNSKKK